MLSPQTLPIPVGRRLVSEEETSRWLERVEEVRQRYRPEYGYLAEGKAGNEQHRAADECG